MSKPKKNPNNFSGAKDRGREMPYNNKNDSYGPRKGTRSPGARTKSIANKPCIMDSVTSNDPSYYNKHAEQYKEVTQVPTWWKVYGKDTGLGHSVDCKTYVPYILPIGMAIDFVPGPGYAFEIEDPVNRAFATMMADLYAKSSSSSLPFQQADLALLTVSISSIANLIAVAKRALGVANSWITTNSYYPVGILKMLGLSYEELQGNRADYITRLNASIYRFNNLRFPDKFDVIHRQYALCHSIYCDEDSSFGQLYAFRPSGYYKYSDETHSANFNRIDWTGSTHFADLLAVIEDLLDSWYNSSDLYLINGALQRAYGDGMFTSVTMCSDTDSVVPVVDRYIMGQIMNMDIRGKLTNCDITQNAVRNTIIWQPRMETLETLHAQLNRGILGQHFIRAYDESVTPDDNMEFTRLMNTVEIIDDNYTIRSGTEIVERVGIYGSKTGLAADTIELSYATYNNLVANNVETVVGYLQSFGPFRYGPRLVFCNLKEGDEVDVTNMALLYDVYNYTTVDEIDVNRLNEVALFSLWYLG